MRWLLLLIPALMLFLGSARVVGAQSPALTVSAPSSGTVITGNTVTVRFQANAFSIVPSQVPLTEARQRPEANRPGEGHVHLMLDLEPVVVWNRAEPYTFSNVPAGEHRLMIELVNNDHAPLSPPVMQVIQFSVTPAMPRSGMGGGAVMASAAGSALPILIASGSVGIALAAGLLGRQRRRRS